MSWFMHALYNISRVDCSVRECHGRTMFIVEYMVLHAADVGFCDCPDILPPDVPTEPTPVVPQPPPGM